MLSRALGWKLAGCGACGVDDDLRFGSCFDCSPHVVARPSGEKNLFLVRDKKTGKRWKAKMHGEPVKVASDAASGKPLVPEERRISPSGAAAAQDDHDEDDGWETYERKLPIEAKEADKGGTLVTLEGPAKYHKGDMIARGARGEKWPIKREIFEETYEKQGATSLHMALGFSKGAGLWGEAVDLVRERGIGSVAREVWTTAMGSKPVQESIEPLRDVVSKTRKMITPRRALIGSGVALGAGVGVAFLDRKKDEALFPQ